MALHVPALAIGARTAPPRAQLRRPDRRARAGARARRAVRAALLGSAALRAHRRRRRHRPARDAARLRGQRGVAGGLPRRLGLVQRPPRACCARSGEVATARRLEETRAVARTLEPGELAGALAQLARADRPRGPTGTREAGRITLVLPGVARAGGYDPRREEPCDALCLALPAGRRPGGRAREPRALAAPPRLDGGRPAARRGRPRPPRGRLRARPPLPPRRRPRAIPSRSCAPSSAPSARPAARRHRRLLRPARRARPRRRAASAAARHAALAAPRRGGRALLAPAARRATACSRADWEGGGWTAGRNRGTSTWTFADDGRIERLVLRFDPAVPRMVAA